ncbi:MAG TPA: hypothetical protein VGC58_00020, partial [Candidatus Paceibacterota bacterium]
MFAVFLPRALSTRFVNHNNTAVSLVEATSTKPVFIPSYVSTPEPVKGIYMTSWVAGTPKLRQNLVDLIEKTELNT